MPAGSRDGRVLRGSRRGADVTVSRPRARHRCVVAASVVASLLLAPAAPAGAAGVADIAGRKRVVRVPASIASDCSVDVTAALQKWIQSVPNSSTLRLRRKACYRIDGTVTVAGRQHLTLDGRGATLQAKTGGDKGRRHLVFLGGRDIVVRNLTVRSTNLNARVPGGAYDGSRAFQHAFSFLGVQQGRLDKVQVYNVFGDFVYIGAGPKIADPKIGVWSRDIKVTNSTFDGSGRQGISITAGKKIVIDRNTIGHAGQTLIDLEANTPDGGAVDVRITRNRTGAARHFWLANKGAGTQIRDIVVEHNRMTEATGALVFVYGPLGGYRGPFRFVDNHFIANNRAFDEGSRGAFFLSRVDGALIRGNVVTFPAGQQMPAVENQDSLNIVVKGNTFTNAGQEIITTTRGTTPRATVPPTTARATVPPTTARPTG
jgi:hypothetical protein